MPSASSSKLVAVRRIQVPKNKETNENVSVEPGDEFTPVSEASRDRLLRIGAAAESNSKEARAAKKRTKADDDDDDEDISVKQ